MSNKMALDALTAAKQPLELYHAYGWPDRDGVRAQVYAAIAALQAEPQPEADMFWDSDDGESFGHSIQDLIAERDVGEVVTVDRAMRLPSIKVRVISGETDEDDNTWEEVIPSTPPKD